MTLFAQFGWTSDALNAVAAIASTAVAFIALIVAVITAYYQRHALRLDWQSNSANMITTFSAAYETDDMRRHRRRFARPC